MNVLNKVTWAAMWKNKTRTIVTIIGIILSAAMFTAVTTLGVSLVGYLIECVVYNDGDYFVRYDYSTDEQLAELRQEESVFQLGDLKALGYSTFYSVNGRGSETCVIAAGDDAFSIWSPSTWKKDVCPNPARRSSSPGTSITTYSRQVCPARWERF